MTNGNDNNPNVVNIFERFSSKKTINKDKKKIYSSALYDPEWKKQARLAIYYADGSVGLLSYAHIIEVLSPTPQQLSIVTTNCIIEMTGEHLTELAPSFRHEDVISLHCYIEAEYEGIEGDGKVDDVPVINTIGRREL